MLRAQLKLETMTLGCPHTQAKFSKRLGKKKKKKPEVELIDRDRVGFLGSRSVRRMVYRVYRLEVG